MVNLKDKASLKGVFEMKVFRKGTLIEEFKGKNHIVDAAGDQAARLIAGDAEGRGIAMIAFGANGAAPQDADDVITNQYARPVSGFRFPEPGQVRVLWELPVAEGNGMAILEFGLLTADGALFARKTRANPLYKEDDVSIEGQWTIEL